MTEKIEKERLLANLEAMRGNLSADLDIPDNYSTWLQYAIDYIKEEKKSPGGRTQTPLGLRRRRNRLLKFRCWNNCSREYIPEDELMDNFAEYLREEHLYIEQFTGFTEQNGITNREIYEGDIIEIVSLGTGQVLQENDGRWVILGRTKQKLKRGDTVSIGELEPLPKWGLTDVLPREYCRIIGNIHENPELLGGEE